MTTSDEQSPDSDERDDRNATEGDDTPRADAAAGEDGAGDESHSRTPSSLGIEVPSDEDPEGPGDTSSEHDQKESLLDDAPTGLAEDTEQIQESAPIGSDTHGTLNGPPGGSSRDEAASPPTDESPASPRASGDEPDSMAEDDQDEGEVIIGGEGEYEDESTMISDDFFSEMSDDEPGDDLPDEGGDLHDEGARGGGAHGEASLDLDDEPEDNDGFDDDYEKTVVSDQMFGAGADGIEEGPAPNVSPDIGSDDAPADSGQESVQEEPASSAPSGDPASGPHAGPNMADAGAAPRNDSHRRGAPAESNPDPAPPPEENQPGPSGGGRESQGDQPDEEFASQKTAMFDSPFEDDPVCPRLSVLEGPSAGQEFLVNGLRNSIGRGTDNSIVIADEATSRQHLEIVKNSDDSYTLQDLQSVNGTYVNGERVEEADLFHGDRIKLGQTVCQFMIPGEQPQREPSGDRRMVPAGNEAATSEPAQAAPHRAQAPPEREGTDWVSKWATRITFGAGFLSIVAIAVLLAATYGRSFGEGGSDDGSKVAKQQYRKGVQAVKKRNWTKARQHFNQAHQANPQTQGVQSQLQRLQRESRAQKSLEQARQALEDGDQEAALEAARSIPQNSFYYEDAQELVRRQERQKRLTKLYEEARQQKEDGDRQEALTTLQDVLSVAPNHGRALALQQRILTDIERDDNEEDASDDEARAEPSLSDSTDDSSTTVASRGSSPSDDSGSSWLLDESGSGRDDSSGSSGGEGGGDNGVVNFQEGFVLYKQENFDQAISHFNQVADQTGGSVSERARTAVQNIKRFKRQYQAGRQAISQSQWSKATSQLRSALATDKKVADSGFFAGSITRRLARVTAEKGIAALDSKNYDQANKLYKQAKQYSSSQSRVRALLRAIEKEAQGLYIRAAEKKKTNPGKAAKLCRRIMNMLPSSSSQYQKAQTLLEEVSN